MYFFCALNEALICSEIGFEATDETGMVSMICLAAEQVISWWIMLNHRWLDPTTAAPAGKPISMGSSSINACEAALCSEDTSSTHFLRSQALVLVINCDHLFKRVSSYFPHDLFLIMLFTNPTYFSLLLFFLKPFRVGKGKTGFFSRSHLRVSFLPFAVLFFRQPAIERETWSPDTALNFRPLYLCCSTGRVLTRQRAAVQAVCGHAQWESSCFTDFITLLLSVIRSLHPQWKLIFYCFFVVYLILQSCSDTRSKSDTFLKGI